MIKTFADMLMHGYIRIERGTYKILNQSAILCHRHFFVELTKSAINDPQKTIDLYETAKKSVISGFTIGIMTEYKLSGKGLADVLVNIAELGGWGKFEIIDYDEAHKRTIIKVLDSAVGTSLVNTTSKPVDHIMRGIMGGMACLIFSSDMDFVETKCIAKGDPYCEFVAKEKSEFLKERSLFVQEQISQVPIDFNQLIKNEGSAQHK